jgi:hypothetical protein
MQTAADSGEQLIAQASQHFGEPANVLCEA